MVAVGQRCHAMKRHQRRPTPPRRRTLAASGQSERRAENCRKKSRRPVFVQRSMIRFLLVHHLHLLI